MECWGFLTQAENAGQLEISMRMLREACPKMFGKSGKLKLLEHETYEDMSRFMMDGDVQPAIVWSVSPFLIAVYSDEMDAVVMVGFDESLAKKLGIKAGQRMISVNVYKYFCFSRDIKKGPRYLKRYAGFIPHIADLISENIDLIENHKNKIPEHLWMHVNKLAEEFINEKPYVARDGRRGYRGFAASNGKRFTG